jgi:acyl-CoA synthetase (AMP-forming)/AMP-acid ligase II
MTTAQPASVRPALVEALLERRRDSREVGLHFVALDGTTTETTLGAFLDDALELAARLHAHGLRPGDVVAVRGSNSLPFSVALVASVLAGVTVLPLVSLLGDADVEQVLALSGARLLLSEPSGPKRSLVDHLTVLAERTGPDVVVLGATSEEVPGAVGLPAGAAAWSADSFAPGPAFLLFTSGTTGVPKGVLHGHSSIWAEVLDWAVAIDVVEAGHVFSAFPLGHIAGLDALLSSVCLGRELTMLAAWDAVVAADALERHGATGGGSTPFYATTLFDELERRGTVASSMRTLQSGGGVVGGLLVRRAERFGITMVRAYGSSEHPSATSCRSDESLEDRAETDGRPTGDTEVRIVDGEVWLRGSEQFLGYVGAESEAFTEDGWFRTGDLGRLVDGRLTITGRLKDIIIRGGENISVVEVEALLAGCPGVADAAVVGLADEQYGERAHAFVVRSPGAPAVDLDAVRAHFAALGVARYKTPEWVHEVPALPRNAMGKVQKHRLAPVGPPVKER